MDPLRAGLSRVSVQDLLELGRVGQMEKPCCVIQQLLCPLEWDAREAGPQNASWKLDNECQRYKASGEVWRRMS